MSNLLSMKSKLKAPQRAFFIYLNIFAPLFISFGYIWSVQSPIRSDLNNQVVYIISFFSFLVFFYENKFHFHLKFLFFYLTLLFISNIKYLFSKDDFYIYNIIFFIYASIFYISFEILINSTWRKLNIILDAIVGSIIVASVISTFILIFQLFGLVDDNPFLNIWMLPGSGVRLSANLAQPNNLATLLLMGLSGVYFLFFERRYIVNTSVFFAVATLLVFSIYLTGSRTSYLVLVIMGMYFYFFWKKIIYAFFPVILLFLLKEIYPFWAQYSGLSFQDVAEKGLNSGRYLIWKMALDVIMDSPWFGHGVGNIIPSFMRVVPKHLEYGEATVLSSAHNFFLDIAIEFGIPISLLFFGCAVFVFYKSLHIKTKKGFFCIFLLIPLSVHSFLEYPLNYSFFLLPFSVFFACYLRFEGMINFIENVDISSRIFFAVNILFVFAVTFFVFNEIYIIENYYKKLRLQKLNFDVPTPYTGNEKCLLDGYCKFLLVNNFDVNNSYFYKNNEDEIRRVANHFPTPNTLMKSIVVNIENHDYELAKTNIISYCLVFDYKYCSMLESFLRIKYKKIDLVLKNDEMDNIRFLRSQTYRPASLRP